ncbi:hypothetical protein KGF56_002948 [Candida oxycetoniae]|uniref:Uncharacterized protein n=1 Tax=Candida oxycetoniae TaxID=497107 RepID=A0AAI9SWD4_9ASCO|nr:uncharacterized protein KGF56_002948 [Candida oxycetoniae]KAI3404187.2 hypothetical protein KGF56_002948 [Candida oxycetoniae]
MMVFAISKPMLFLTIIIQFIATVLLSFLLLGCINTSSNYSSVYLFQYKYNSSSTLYKNLSPSLSTNITATTSASNSTLLSDVHVSIGYLAACIDIATQKTCTYYSQIQNIPQFSISFDGVNFNLLNIATSFNEICHPHLLMATIILTLVCLIILCYMILPLPFRPYMEKFGALLSFINLLLWGLGAMLQLQSVKTSDKMVQQSSFDLISGVSGSRAEIMTWISFAFNFIVFASLLLMNWQRFRTNRDLINEDANIVSQTYLNEKV